MDNHRPSSPGAKGPHRRARVAAVGALAAGLIFALAVQADSPPDKSKPRTQAPKKTLASDNGQATGGAAADRFWFDRKRQGAAAAAQVVGAREPLLAGMLEHFGRKNAVWPRQVSDLAPPLSPALLSAVGQRDNKGFLDLRGIPPDELQGPRYLSGYMEYQAYCQAILNAAQTPPEAFAKSAAENPGDLTFGHLYRQPDLFRGKAVHLEGRLKRVTRLDAPIPAQKQGIKAVYEAAIFLKNVPFPVIVVFTDLPEGLKVGDYDRTRPVSFDGYFFKKYRYVGGYVDKKTGRPQEYSTLLFIAPTLTLRPLPAEEAPTSPLPRPVLYGVVGFVALTIGLVVVISLLYRRTDRKVRARLQGLQAERFEQQLLMPPGSEEGAPEAPAGAEQDGEPRNGSGDGAHGH